MSVCCASAGKLPKCANGHYGPRADDESHDLLIIKARQPINFKTNDDLLEDRIVQFDELDTHEF